MSVESIAVALHHSRATGTAKLVLIGIANHDGDGGAWPSQKTLAKYAGVSRQRVKAATDKLVELGEIGIERNGGGTRWAQDWERPHLYSFLLKCPETCDRTSQHRDKTKHELAFYPRTYAVRGGGIEIPDQVSPEYPHLVPAARQEPPINPTTKEKETGYSTRACATCEKQNDHGGRICDRCGCSLPVIA